MLVDHITIKLPQIIYVILHFRIIQIEKQL